MEGSRGKWKEMKESEEQGSKCEGSGTEKELIREGQREGLIVSEEWI